MLLFKVTYTALHRSLSIKMLSRMRRWFLLCIGCQLYSMLGPARGPSRNIHATCNIHIFSKTRVFCRAVGMLRPIPASGAIDCGAGTRWTDGQYSMSCETYLLLWRTLFHLNELLSISPHITTTTTKKKTVHLSKLVPSLMFVLANNYNFFLL